MITATDGCVQERERQTDRQTDRQRQREHDTYRVDVVNALGSFITLSPHPVPVEISADAVQHFGGELVVLPLACVKLEDLLIQQVLTILTHNKGHFKPAVLNVYI